MESPKQPTIYIVTPVFNAQSVLAEFFAGLDQTTYPKDKLIMIMPDGGSTDGTQAAAQGHGAVVIDNPLKTAEAGKAVGVRYVLEQLQKQKADLAENLICLLDSDNILVDPDWFERMVAPFAEDKEIIGTEPWEYIRRDSDGYITRYTAMTSINDPVSLFLGTYDRLNLLSGTWTGLPIKTTDKGGYLVWTINPKIVPTIGANGAMFRASFFQAAEIGDFLFDIDVLYEYTLTRKAKFAKVKIGLVHIYCRTINDFIRKQSRRIKDYQYFQAMGLRKYPWSTINKKGLLAFLLSCVTIVPLFWQVAQGMSKKADLAWFFHPIACWITLWIYGSQTIMAKLRKPALADRTAWRQS